MEQNSGQGNPTRPDCHKTFNTQKSSNQNEVYIWYSVLIFCVFFQIQTYAQKFYDSKA
jgi:hypothetical protein